MSALVAVDALAAAIAGGGPPVVLDVRWTLSAPGGTPTGPTGREGYDTAHLPGAVFVDLEEVLASHPVEPDAQGRRPGGRHPLPDPDLLQTALRAAGVDDGSSVVVYDGGNGWGAARAWWILRWAGVGDVRVLDGGLPAWLAAGHPTTTEEPSPPTGSVTVVPGSVAVLDADSAAVLARDGILLDARAPERYAGDVEPLDPVAGHVPGALSAPTTGNVGPDGRYLPAEVLRERFVGLGATGEVPVGVYCGSGVSAAQEVLALHEAGIDAALYVGSWSDWVGTGRAPATGPEPG